MKLVWRDLRYIADKSFRLPLAFFYFCLFYISSFAQEILPTALEREAEILFLTEGIDKPFLNYSTFSDSWFESPRSLGRSSSPIELNIYDPVLFYSWNSTAPYGQNDGALWQGRGLNMSVRAGMRMEVAGIELVLLPHLGFSTNEGFPLVNPNSSYSGTLYEGKAAEWGYYGISGIDAPQRFGDDPLYWYSWGDSELRYTLSKLTIGFGTQAVWLGPARLNPILLSNNAPPFPKIDIGLRRTELSLFGYDFGDIEARTFWGKLEESDFFDNNSSNNSNLLTGLSVSFSPSVLPGLTLGLHRIMLSSWSDLDYSSVLTLLWPFMERSAGQDRRDQRASLSISYALPLVGLELYLEYGRNDYSPNIDYVIRYPFHTQGYTLGLDKAFSLNEEKGIFGKFLIELTYLESSRDYELAGATTFYAHHIITQGHTNNGQWLGAGIGTGGNSQYSSFSVYYPAGAATVYLQRRNPDNDYIWFMSTTPTEDRILDQLKIRADLTLGIAMERSLLNGLNIQIGMAITDIHNLEYNGDQRSNHTYNFSAYSSLRIDLD